jgi:hypothetical protein
VVVAVDTAVVAVATAVAGMGAAAVATAVAVDTEEVRSLIMDDEFIRFFYILITSLTCKTSLSL